MKVLMAYGFCVENNPHDSLSLRLPNDPTLYMLTRSQPLSQPLLTAFATANISPRELAQNVQNQRRNLLACRTALLALVAKAHSIGWDSRPTPTPTTKYIELYRASQRELVLLSYNAIVVEYKRLLDERDAV